MRNIQTLLLLFVAIVLGWPHLAAGEAPTSTTPPQETPADKDARMRWWREARFGMFIHWGVYSVAAGEWNGKPVGGAGEWIMNGADIPVAEYEPLSKRFNPLKYDPAEWVRIAKDAGMEYVVITSKHHDGFCLFDTKTTDWDVVDRTPYGKDLLMPLADECRKQGLKFCTYHSIMDWHHPAQTRGGKTYNPTQIKPGRKQEFTDYLRAQLQELLDSCDPEVMWFDGEWLDWWEEADGREIYAWLRERKPSLIINNRVGRGRDGMEGLNKGDQEYVGDFGTPEQQIPATGVPGVDWESCMTMNDTWGFHKHDHNWKSAETLVRNLVDIASKGGNYLLNVGPTADGEIPPESVERLSAIGKWMHANGESIHATTASPFAALAWGRCTARQGDDHATLYLHVFDWPPDGKLRVPGLRSKTGGARLLATGQALTAERDGDDTIVSLPVEPLDPIDTVVVLETAGPLDIATP